MSYCRTNAGADRGLCRADARTAFVRTGYSVSVFSNSASMLIAMLGLSGHSNGYRATVTMARNNGVRRTDDNNRVDSYRKS